MKTGIALSGGGARGFAHFGVLQALDELGIEINAVSGTSAGSIAGAFYAHGYKPTDALELISKTNLFKIIWPAFSLSGLINMSKSEDVFKKFFKEDTFDNAQIPLQIIATNLNEGRKHVFSTGPLVKAMMASSCIPFIFDPVRIGDEAYVDGGIVNNLPAEVLRSTCDIVIGVSVAPVIRENELGGPKRMIERISMVGINANVSASKEHCDILIEPTSLRKYSTFDMKKAHEIYKIGYESAHHYFDTHQDDPAVIKLLTKAKTQTSTTAS
ncbi:patatin-like phospholipase family protein [Roseivirga seohaensis]|uniref:patatin-like phospholipase family protein n=1 Tax=Roseivirga seohaensis TaxID=1914963 RepID=UPI003BAB8C71